MSWTQIATGIAGGAYMIWIFWRTERQFQAGYQRALDHVEELTRERRPLGAPSNAPPVARYTAKEAVAKLRAESKPKWRT